MKPPADRRADAAESLLGQAEDLSRWLARANALWLESLRLPAGLLEPYAVLLSGDLGGAAEQLSTFLDAQPNALEATISLNGVRQIRGETADGFLIREATDRQQQDQLRLYIQG